MRARCLLPLVATALLLSCKSPRVPAPQQLGPVSAEEARAVAMPLAAALTACDHPALAMLFDRQWLFQAAARSTGLGARAQRALYESLQSRRGFASSFLCTPEQDLVYVGIRKTAVGQSLIFRASDVVGLNYLEFRIGKQRDGDVRCVGRLDYREGWHLQDLLAMSAEQGELVATLARMRETLADSPRSVRADAEKYSEERVALALAVRAGARVGESAYREALGRYREDYPGDASIYIQVYEDLASAGRYALADEAIVALQQAVNDSEGLLSTRVALLLEGEQFAKATKLAEEALLAHPEAQEAHYRLLEALVESRNFGGAVAVMRLMGERFNVRFTEASMDTSHAAYVDLLASDAWSAY